MDNAWEKFWSADYDSMLSVVRQKRFLWKEDENKIGKPLNYDPFMRPRRQDFDGYLMENGSAVAVEKE